MGMQLLVADVKGPESRKIISPANGNPIRAFDWSPDGKWIVSIEYVARKSKSRIHLINLETGINIQLSPTGQRGDFYDQPIFSNDGDSLYLLSNQNSEYIRLASLNIKTQKLTSLTGNIPWDIESFVLSPDGKKIAITSNEDGISRLRFLNPAKRTMSPPIETPSGLISSQYWSSDSKDLAFLLNTPQTPGDIYVVDSSLHQASLWSKANVQGPLGESSRSPETIHWKSFDGKSISGYLYRPSIPDSDRRPVLIEIHGGPESQARPEFDLDQAMMVKELGLALICPNIRGSTGYGKTFASLDNGLRREDALKDIGALFEWIRRQPDLDSNRVVVTGDSYGGYMALLTATHYSSLIRGAICESGPSNLATFLETTDGWRRELRRQEYGDERDPILRRMMEKSAPRNNPEKIKKPLLILHGAMDSRVRVEEAQRMIEAMKLQRAPLWSVIDKNEGHSEGGSGFYPIQFGTKILFLKRFLFGQTENQ